MSTIATAVDRVDGRLKVTGGARYAAEFTPPDTVHAVIVSSSVPTGIISHMDTTATAAAPGVLLVMTPQNAPKLDLSKASDNAPGFPLLQDSRILFSGQHIAVIIASTLEQAKHGASLLKTDYAESIAIPGMADNPLQKDVVTAERFRNGARSPDSQRGEPASAFADAPIKVDALYRTPIEHHNPMEPHATVAVWDRDHLTVYNATQAVTSNRDVLAQFFSLPKDNVRVISPFVGGGFGCKGNTWPHIVLAAMAAKMVKRPVKLVLSRRQMYFSNGYRPKTVQRVKLGAAEDGRLVAIQHDGISQSSAYQEYSEPVGLAAEMLYSCANVGITHRLVKVNQGLPTYMRAPGESSGMFALESAMDELSYKLRMDPIALRLKNYASFDEHEKKPFSSKSLKECYLQGAKAFDWQRRQGKPGTMRSGQKLTGLGMATATYPMHRSEASAKVILNANGTALVMCGSQDIGTGTYTIMAQVTADGLGLPIQQVRPALGDSTYPQAPVSGGSQSAASITPAIQAACENVKQQLVALVIADALSPLHGTDPATLMLADGRVAKAGDFSRSEAYSAILSRHKRSSIEGNGTAKQGDEKKQFSMHSFGAHFAEVQVDASLGEVRVTRYVGAFAAGRILNLKTGRSQMLSGIIYGLGMALLEETETDPRWGRPTNASLAEYLLPVNADVPEIDVIFVPEEDAYVNPLGAKGIGELPMVGVAAAVCNAVYNATGKRIRDLPIRPEKILL